ncbi:MAG: hypothetical protein M3Y21_05375 [Candidatus Eremiobacteraeota bacterium]|nr:hypothetical protein [Candidatus Eremiobacteraeota bacterium]
MHRAEQRFGEYGPFRELRHDKIGGGAAEIRPGSSGGFSGVREVDLRGIDRGFELGSYIKHPPILLAQYDELLT